MKKLIVASILSTATISLSFAEEEQRTTPEQHISKLTERISKENQEDIIKLITDKSVLELESDIKGISWTDAHTEELKSRLKSKKSKVIASIFGTQLGISSISELILDEMKEVQPDLKNLSPKSQVTIDKKLLPALDKIAANTIFSSSTVTGNIGVRNGSSVFDVGAEFCFKPIAITNKKSINHGCIKAQLGTITGISLVNGRIDLEDGKVANGIKDLGLGITLSAINLQHNFSSNHFTLEFVRPGLEYKPKEYLSIRLETPVGIDSNGLYANADLKIGLKDDFSLFKQTGCYGLDAGASFGVDGNIQLYTQAKALVDIANSGFRIGAVGQYLHNSEAGNTRGNQTLSGGQFYGPGYYGGLLLEYRK